MIEMNAILKNSFKGRRDFIKKVLVTGLGLGIVDTDVVGGGTYSKTIRIGIIGLSVHSADFTEILNAKADPDLSDCRVVAIYHPPGNEDVEFSREHLQKFSDTIKHQGVEFLDSIEAVLEKVDAVMLLTNDGRPHLEQVLPVLKSGKPVYIDKPLAENLPQVNAIFQASKQYGVPIFTSSALRYGKNTQDIRRGEVVGKVLGADAYSPAPLQPSHVDLFWDGIHGVETLYTVMGTGCRSVTCTHQDHADVAVGTWSDGRIGVFRGLRQGKIGFGGTVYGSDGITAIGAFSGYRSLVVAIADFFRTGKSPVSNEETIEIYTFMAAAEESRRKGGVPVELADVLAEAKMKRA
jgi:predicted dehydrogenase